MDFDAVYKAFCTLADLDRTDGSAWVFLVHECVDDIAAMVIDESVITAQKRRKLNGLAAARAMWQYRKILSAGGSLSGLKAGDITLNADKESVAQAFSLYCEKLAECSDVLDTGDFVFGRTDSLCTEEI